MESPKLFNLFVPTSKTKIPWAGIVTEVVKVNQLQLVFLCGSVSWVSLKPVIVIPPAVVFNNSTHSLPLESDKNSLIIISPYDAFVILATKNYQLIRA